MRHHDCLERTIGIEPIINSFADCAIAGLARTHCSIYSSIFIIAPILSRNANADSGVLVIFAPHSFIISV